MDADFSHTVSDLSKLLKNKDNNDLVIGSRYVDGGAVEGWNNIVIYCLFLQINILSFLHFVKLTI